MANPERGNQALFIRIRGRQRKTQKRPNTEPQGELELNLFLWRIRRVETKDSIRIRVRQSNTQKRQNTEPQGELELMGNQVLSITIRGRQRKTQKRPNTEPQGDLELNLGCCEPGGRKSSALYQNPGSTA